ncbi:MAG: DNA mismatch repair protein [Saprospiraceae bacterium]|nr:MAG: DNA mismatch repair protein [Saprospiraceae bacterium]
MTDQQLTTYYEERISRFSAIAEKLRKRYEFYSLVRLFTFLGAVGLISLLWTIHWGIGLGSMVLFLFLFYRFVQWHLTLESQAKHHESLTQINQQERDALDHQYQAFADGGEYVEPEHPYTLDLDIFGPWSLFQYINRATTGIGQALLAKYFKAPATSPLIMARQEAIEELSKRADWRQDFRALGLDCKDSPAHLRALRLWLTDENIVLGKKGLTAALYLAPIWVICGILLWIFYFNWTIFLLWMIPVVLIIRKTMEAVDKTHSRTAKAGDMLNTYARLIQHLEQPTFQSGLLQRLHAAFMGKKAASSSINRLSYIISQLNVRFNIFAVFLNLIGLWDLQWVYRLEKWRHTEKERLPQWFASLAELEALSSLANLSFNHPSWTFPTLHEKLLIEAVQLGHPLIHVSQRVSNDIELPVRGHIKLVTGSNMAGKSTFLRTVGLNAVLALAGAPVCAKKMALPQIQVFTSMRTQDALHESTSSFYAELKRLKFIIEAVEVAYRGEHQERPVFFLLDEILKGTNSVDRHTGSKALIQQLIRSEGGGIIATHDLELGQLEATANGAVENLCIEVEIRDGKLYFDYTIKKGVSKSFNATLLMQQMGIRIGEV